MAGSGLPLIAAAVCIPFTLNRIGNESFGVLTLIWALIGYFSLFDMGVGRALTYELSKLRADVDVSKQHREISLTLKAGLLITIATGVFGALLMLLLAGNLATKWLNISSALQQDAKLAFQIAALGIIPTTLTSGLRGALEGLERFAGSNVNKLILGFCMFALPALVIMLHGNHLWLITLYLVSARITVTLIAILQLKGYLFISKVKAINNRLVYIKSRIKSLLNYGVWISVTGIVGPLMVYGDRFFVSAAVGAALLPLYAIPQEGLQRLLMIPAALSGALLPQLSKLPPSSAASVYKRNYKRIALIMLSLCSLAAALIYTVLSWWLSADFAQQALPIALVLCLGIWFNGVALVPYTLIHANGNPKITAIFHLLELVLYAVALWWLANQFGLIGAAWAWVARVVLDMILLHNTANKILKANELKNE